MKIIIPMAGRGSRLRPHTLVTPKPLIPIAGKPIVHRLAEDIVKIYQGQVDEIAFIIGDFGKEVENDLLKIAENLGAKGTIYYQKEPLGTAHAIWMAKESMEDEIIIAFADTLFRADFVLDRSRDGVIWVKTVENPSAFGVVTLNEEGVIDAMVEKPKEFVSDLAIIGIYYVKNGAALREEIRHIIENDLKEKGEYQLTNALENLKNKGAKFVPGKVDVWMDCGNKEAVLDTTHNILLFGQREGESWVSETATVENSIIIPPSYIGPGAIVQHSVVGPFSSIDHNAQVRNCVIERSSIGIYSRIENMVLKNALVGNYVTAINPPRDLDIGDYCRL